MSTAAERWTTAAGTFTRRAQAVPAEGWDAPTPCVGWVARDIVEHLVEWVPPFLAAGSDVTVPPGPPVGTDPAAAWQHLADVIQDVLDDPAVSGRRFDHDLAGSHPLDAAIDMFVTGDVLVHTWDLARATGQDEHLDDVLVADALAGMEPMADALAASGHYAPAVDVPPDADPQTRLIALTGRDPDGPPRRNPPRTS